MARPIAKDHDEKRALILERAAQLFAKEGFAGASVKSLAQACGISKANIYHYYSGKDAILYDLLEAHLRGLRDRLHGLDLTDCAPEAAFARTVTEILLAYEGADDAHRVQANAIDYLDAAQQRKLRGYQRDLVACLAARLVAIAPDTLGKDAAKLRATTMSVFGMLNWFYMWHPQANSLARKDYAALVCRLSQNGITAV